MLALGVALALTAVTCPVTPAPRVAVPPPGHFAFATYGAEDGLENLADQNLAQDAEGFLWTGSQDGLYRYNGARFQRFGLEQGLPSTWVSALHAGADGRFWAGTREGVARLRGGAFARVDASDGLPPAVVHGLATSPSGRLWVASKLGLFREIPAGRDATTVRFELAPGWPGGEASAVWIDADDAAYASREGTLHRLAPSGAWEEVGPPSALGDAPILGIARDARRRLWIHSRTRLAVLAEGGKAWDDRSCLLPSASSEGALSLDARGRLLVPTAGGVLRIDDDDADVVDQAHGLQTDESFAALEDREGSLWIASAGVQRLRGRGVWTSFTPREGLPNDVVYSIGRDRDGGLWCGTDDGLARATSRGWSLVPGTRGHSFRALRGAPDGAMWGGGSPGELLRVDAATDAVTVIGARAGLPGAQIMGFDRDASGTLWVATRGRGLYRGDPARAPLRFEPYLLPGGSLEEEIDWVTTDAEGRVWIAGERGLALIASGVATRFTTRDGLRANHVTGVLPRARGEVCVEYFDPIGLSCFHVYGAGLEKLRHVDAAMGLPSGKVYSLGEDRDGRLWAGTAIGIARLGASLEVTDLFRRSDGTPGDDFDAMAFLGDTGGDVWVGTSTGLGRFDGAHDPGPPPPPRSILESVRLGDRALPEPFPDDVRLPYDRASLDVRFAALGFVNEGRIVHEVRLLGEGDRWRPSDAPEQRYAALRPGAYRFEVRARFGEGPPGEAAHVAFVVDPAWWQTWWARVLAATALAFAVVLGSWWRLRRLSARNVALEALVAARGAELTQALAKVAESERLSALGRLLAHLSHELNNPINVISNNLGPMKEYLESLVRALDECRVLAEANPAAAARVLALWEELDLDFVRTDFGKALRSVDLAAGRVRAVHSDLRAFMQGRAAKRDAGDVTVPLAETVQMVRRGLPPAITIVERYAQVPPVLLHAGQLNQVFLNLIQNASDAVGDRGVITVTADVRGDHVEVSIEDSGPGVPAAARARIFEPFFTTKDFGKGTGLGLAICRQIIVGTHGGTIDLDASAPAGARFVLRFPIASAASIAAARAAADPAHPPAPPAPPAAPPSDGATSA